MYICVCNAVTDSDIREAVESGVRSLGQLKSATGCSAACGCCRETAKDVLRQALDERRDGLCILPVMQAA